MAKRNRSLSFTSALPSVRPFRLAVLLLLGVAGAWFAFALALAGTTRIKNPGVALNVVPTESVALATRGDQLFFANPKAPPAKVRSLALAALKEQAINPKAVRLLGYYDDANGDAVRAEKFVRMAEKLSRRETGAQLWLIEAAARDGDATKTLGHYDIALRTKSDVQAILFPRLLSAIDDEAVRKALVPYIRNDSRWIISFLFYANSQSKNLPTLVDLMVESGGPADKKEAQSYALDLLSRLVGQRYFAEARRLFTRMPGANSALLTSPSFTATDRTGRFGPMGWQLTDDSEVGGGFSSGPNGKSVSLSVFANPATTRPVASRLLYLASGSYNFRVKLDSLSRGDGGFLRWQLRCPADGAGQPVWSLDSTSRLTNGHFSVPASCPVQIIDLIVSGGNAQTGLEATIASVSATPTGN